MYHAKAHLNGSRVAQISASYIAPSGEELKTTKNDKGKEVGWGGSDHNYASLPLL